MRTIDILLRAKWDDESIVARIDAAIVQADLRVTMRGTLKSFPGSTHWHLKSGKASGTLEITYWPAERRAWFSIQAGRAAEWIDGKLEELQRAISASK